MEITDRVRVDTMIVQRDDTGQHHAVLPPGLLPHDETRHPPPTSVSPLLNQDVLSSVRRSSWPQRVREKESDTDSEQDLSCQLHGRPTTIVSRWDRSSFPEFDRGRRSVGRRRKARDEAVSRGDGRLMDRVKITAHPHHTRGSPPIRPAASPAFSITRRCCARAPVPGLPRLPSVAQLLHVPGVSNRTCCWCRRCPGSLRKQSRARGRSTTTSLSYRHGRSW